MNFEDWSSAHFLIAGVFALALTLGSFAVTAKMQSLSNSEMADVSGQEGILMDLHMSGFIINEVTQQDNDGANATGNATGGVGMHNITFTGAGKFTGMTVDFDGSTNVGTQTGVGAIVLGLPNIPGGILINGIDPGGADIGSGSGQINTSGSQGVDTFTQINHTNGSMGSVLIGGISRGGTRVEISTNPN